MTFWPLDSKWFPNRSDFPPISWPWYRAWPSPNYEWFSWSICNGCGMPAGNAYPSGHLVPSLILGLVYALVVETTFPESTPMLWPWYRNWPSPNYERFPLSICDGGGMPAGSAYPSGHLVSPPFKDSLMLQHLVRPIFRADWKTWHLYWRHFLVLWNSWGTELDETWQEASQWRSSAPKSGGGGTNFFPEKWKAKKKKKKKKKRSQRRLSAW